MNNSGAGCLTVVVIALAFLALIALFGSASGMETVLTVEPAKISPVPADGIKLFLELLGF
jgi:hypothetical protein